MWFLFKRVYLTKGNLAGRNWNGCKNFVRNLFIICFFLFYLIVSFRIVEFAYNLPTSANIKNLFANWLRGLDKLDKACVRVSVCALLWSLWTYRSDFVFMKTGCMNYLQVMLKATHHIRTWSVLLPVK